jgi:hypothetical protein
MSTRWTLVIPENTDKVVRSHLALSGTKKGDLSQFVDRAVRQAVFWETSSELKTQNSDEDPASIEAAVKEAVSWARENRP